MNKILMNIRTLVAAACISTTLLACTASTESGISGSGAPVLVASGPVSGFGSIIVNGEYFTTDSATIIIDGQTSTEAALQIGSYVKAIAANEQVFGKNVADKLILNTDVQGTVTSFNHETKTLTVLGQQIQITLDTIAGQGINSLFDDLDVGSIIAASGLRTAEHVLLARRIDRIDENSTRPYGAEQGLVSGRAAKLDSAINTFRIGDLLINFNGDSENETVRDGELVQAYVPPLASNGSVTATRVRKLNDIEIDGYKLKMESLIETVLSDMEGQVQLTIGGYQAVVDQNTKLISGTLSSLSNGTAIAAEGIVVNDTLLINQIEFIQPTSQLVTATVSSIAMGPTSNIAEGNIILDTGMIILSNANTRYIDSSATGDRYFSFDKIRPNDVVTISGYLNDDLANIARTIQRTGSALP